MTTKQWEARQKKEIMEDIKGRVLLVKALRRQLEVSNNNYENRETLSDITSNQTQIIKLANSLLQSLFTWIFYLFIGFVKLEESME